MTSEELAEFLGTFVSESQGRVLGTGNDQYSRGDRQKFEDMSLEELCDWAQEELQDVAAYATMLSWKINGIQKILAGVDE